MNFELPVSPEILAEISKLDHFQGVWSAQQIIPSDRLPRLREAARLQSVSASCRLAGLRVSDADVAGLLRGESLPLRDSIEILGYAHALQVTFPGNDELLNGDLLRRLHGQMMGVTDTAAGAPWRDAALHREAFDANGRALGAVFPTLPPRMVEEKTEQALTWLELELRAKEQHPILTIGAFVLCFLSISPFDRGNGRMARLLANRLLERAGYAILPYASLENQIEELREECHAAVLRSQTQLWTEDANLEPWLNYFLKVLGRHRDRVEAKIDLERQVHDYPPLQRAILEAVREHGSVDAALLIRATGANRNTLKDNLRRLVQRGVLEKTGQRRGTRYRLAAGEPARAATGEVLGH